MFGSVTGKKIDDDENVEPESDESDEDDPNEATVGSRGSRGRLMKQKPQTTSKIGARNQIRKPDRGSTLQKMGSGQTSKKPPVVKTKKPPAPSAM